jgi:hypothetical protein
MRILQPLRIYLFCIALVKVDAISKSYPRRAGL